MASKADCKEFGEIRQWWRVFLAMKEKNIVHNMLNKWSQMEDVSHFSVRKVFFEYGCVLMTSVQSLLPTFCHKKIFFFNLKVLFKLQI